MPSRSRGGGSGKKGKAAHTTPAQSDIVLPPKLNLKNIRVIAQARNDDNNNINIHTSKEDRVEQTKKGAVFFSTPHTQQEQQEQSASSPTEQSTALDALRTSPTITTTNTSALVNHTDTGDVGAQVNSANKNNNNKRASSSSLSISSPLSQQPRPALRHTGPVVTEEWSRSVVHPGDEHLLYQNADLHSSIPRSARRTVHHTNITSTSNNTSTVHHNRTPRRNNSFSHATTHSATLMNERAPRHRQASEQLAQQRQAEEERQRQRTVRITRFAPATSTAFSRDVSLASNAQEAGRNPNPSISSSVTRLALNAANTRRAESMDYATLGHSLARSTSYLRAPSECSLQEGVVNSNAPRAASVISTTTANLYTDDNNFTSSSGVVAGQLSYTATGTSKKINATDESITISSDVCVGETSPVVRANARQARARNAALFFTRPSFYLTEESTSVKQHVNIITDAMTSTNDATYSVNTSVASAECSPAMRTPLSVQYTGNGVVSGYRTGEVNTGDDEMALMMRRRAELLAQLALHNNKNTNSTTSTKDQQEVQKKIDDETQAKATTKNTTSLSNSSSSSRKAIATSSTPYVLPSSLRGRLKTSNAPPSQRPLSRLRRLPNIALTSIAELQPSTNTQTLNNNNTTSAAAAALEPVALDELLQAQPFTAVTVEKKKNVSAEPHTSTTSQITLRLRDDAATMRLLCDPFFPLVSEENHQRLQMCEAEHHARQALALWLSGSMARAATKKNSEGNERESPVPELPLTAIALDFGEDVEKKQVKASHRAQGSGDVAVHEVEESTKEEQDSTVLHTISSSTQMGQQSINKDDSANKASTNKSQLPYGAPRPIRLSRRGRRKQQQQRQQEEAKRSEVVTASDAPSAEQAEADTGITPTTTTTTSNTLAQSSLTNSPNRPCPRMTSPNRLIVNAVMPSEKIGVVQPLITSVLGYRSNTSTSSSTRSTSPPLVPTLTPPHTPPKGSMSNAGNSGGSSSTSGTGVLLHSPLKQIVQHSPPRQDDEVEGEKEEAVASEPEDSTAPETTNVMGAEAEAMRKEEKEAEEIVPELVPCETTKHNVKVASSQDTVVATTAEAANEPVQAIKTPAVMTQKTNLSLYSAELRDYMRHALHSAESNTARVTQQTSCNEDDEDELRRCYFRHLRRELHLDRTRTVKNKQQNTTTEALNSDSNNDIRVMTEMLEDGSYQQENVRYVLEVFGTTWQQPEALRSPHIIAPQGKTPDDVLVLGGGDMEEESIALPSRIRATQLLFH